MPLETYVGVFDRHHIYLAPQCTEQELSWDEAVTYCSELTLDGVEGWELPSRLVLLWLYEQRDRLDLTASYYGINMVTYYWHPILGWITDPTLLGDTYATT